MAEFPALPLWTDAYLGDTTHLTTIEHGAYLLLLMAMWRSPTCSLPHDDKLLARYAKLNAAQWARIKPVLMPFFRLADNHITQGRLTDEASLVRQTSRKASNSAKVRWLKNKGLGDAVAMQTQCEGNAPTPTPCTLLSDDKRVTQHDDGDLQAASDAWNELAAEAGLPAMQVLTKPRRTKLRARLNECGGLDGWAYALGKVRDSPFLRGQNKTGWKADFDFLLQQKSFTKLMEGAYDRAKQTDGWDELLRNAEDFYMA